MSKLVTRRDGGVLRLPNDRAAVRTARTYVQKALASLGMLEKVDDAELIADELVMNVLKHVRPDEFYMEVKPDECRVWIGVWDPSHTKPTIKMPSGDEEFGRGLLLVLHHSEMLVVDILPDELGGGKIVAARL